MQHTKEKVSPILVVLAFAILYIVWGSTYFFIQKAMVYIPPMLLGAFRFLAAGALMLAWCAARGEKLFNWQQVKRAAVTGILLLFVGTGAVIWAEKTLPSSLVAMIVASEAIWLVLLDKPNWKSNLTNKNTILGLVAGFIGVLLLFGETALGALTGGHTYGIAGFAVLVVGTISWAGGSLYSKARPGGSAFVSAAWQMLAAGLVFLPFSALNHEWHGFEWQAVPAAGWLSVSYLVVMGSLAGFSAYVWLLRVKPVTQVSTHVYVNPVVAVLLGMYFGNEHLSWLQMTGLVVILSSVLLINLAKYRYANTRQTNIRVQQNKLSCSPTS
jgi:drug/metabolite transporter (DMT)-like permease